MGVPIDPVKQRPIPNNLLTTENSVWVDFIFNTQNDKSLCTKLGPDRKISVQPFLSESLYIVKTIILKVESILEQNN